jgi:hypothetical protein
MEQKITSTTPQRNLKQNREPCLTATSAATTRGMGGLGPRWQTLWQHTALRAVTAARAPGGTKKSLPVTAAECVWKTKRPYKQRQKKSDVPAPAPQAAAPAEAPAPVPPLFTADNAVARAPAEKKSHPVLVAAPAVAPAPFSFGEPIHPSGVVVKIVGTEMSCQGRSCEEHDNCGDVLKEDVVVRLRKIQLMVEGKEETAIAAIWVTGGIDRCRVGFVPRHMVRHAPRYDGAPAQVTRVFSNDPETCDSTE